jgi:hypothetical protein
MVGAGFAGVDIDYAIFVHRRSTAPFWNIVCTRTAHGKFSTLKANDFEIKNAR